MTNLHEQDRISAILTRKDLEQRVFNKEKRNRCSECGSVNLAMREFSHCVETAPIIEIEIEEDGPEEMEVINIKTSEIQTEYPRFTGQYPVCLDCGRDGL